MTESVQTASMARLSISLTSGTIEIEGEEAFVREAFADVRSSMAALKAQVDLKNVTPGTLAQTPLQGEVLVGEPPLASEKNKSGKQAAAKSGVGTNYLKPPLNTSLNLAKLDEVFDSAKPSRNPEKVLLFTGFLRDTLAVSPCTPSDIYTCFFHLKGKNKIPEAFGKALKDTKAAGFIETQGADGISITTVGENALVKLNAKKPDAA